MHTWISLALALPALAAPARSQPAQQQGVEVTARLSTGLVKLGASAQLSVQVDGAADARLGELPRVDGLRLGPVSGPSTEQFFEIKNGRKRVSTSARWSIALRPERAGEFTIPPIAVEVGGERYATPEQRLRAVEDVRGEDLGYFEMRRPEQVYEGQPFTLELAFGWDAALGNKINYAALSLPWYGQLPGTLEVASPARLGQTTPIQLINPRGEVEVEVLGAQDVGGRRVVVLRLRKRYIASRPGKLDLPASHLEFGTAVERGFGLLSERVVQEVYYKRAPAAAIEVLELPEQGRPFDFTGAVGRIEAQADVDRREVDAGESIKLTVEWTGDGNLEFFEPPDPARIEAFAGFRVYGQTDKKSPDRRAVTYDIAPMSDAVDEVPPLPLSVFDTGAGRYTTVTTRSIPIRVRPLAGAAGLEPSGRRELAALDIRDIHAAPEEGRDRPRPGAGTALAALAGVPLAWLGLRTLVRRRGDPASREARLRRGARARLARELARAATAGDEARALLRFLGARSGEPDQAWLGRDVAAYCAARGGVAPEAARALAELFARLDERTWAGDDAPLGRAEVLAVADRLVRGGL